VGGGFEGDTRDASSPDDAAVRNHPPQSEDGEIDGFARCHALVGSVAGPRGLGEITGFGNMRREVAREEGRGARSNIGKCDGTLSTRLHPPRLWHRGEMTQLPSWLVGDTEIRKAAEKKSLEGSHRKHPSEGKLESAEFQAGRWTDIPKGPTDLAYLGRARAEDSLRK